jgi:hypothetical protein
MLFSCSKDELTNVPDHDLITVNTTTFVSERYDINAQDTDASRDVIRFRSGKIEYFTSDDYGNIQGGTRSTTGVYKLDYPLIYDILAVHIFDEESITITRNGTVISFYAGGKLFTDSLERFD